MFRKRKTPFEGGAQCPGWESNADAFGGIQTTDFWSVCQGTLNYQYSSVYKKRKTPFIGGV